MDFSYLTEFDIAGAAGKVINTQPESYLQVLENELLERDETTEYMSHPATCTFSFRGSRVAGNLGYGQVGGLPRPLPLQNCTAPFPIVQLLNLMALVMGTMHRVLTVKQHKVREPMIPAVPIPMMNLGVGEQPNTKPG